MYDYDRDPVSHLMSISWEMTMPTLTSAFSWLLASGGGGTMNFW